MLLIATLLTTTVMAETIEKCAESFDQPTWHKNQWSTASASVHRVDPCPESKLGVSKGALRFDVSFTGKGFEHMNVEPAEAIHVPGKLKRISFYA